MTARLIDGRKIASDIKENLKMEVSELSERGINPCLAVVFDGTDAAARRYAALKRKACADVGIDILINGIQKTTNQSDLVKFIEKLNRAPKINGILLQFPLRDGLYKNIMSVIAPEKDVDGCVPHPFSKTSRNKPHFIPSAFLGVIEMLEKCKIKIDGKHAVIVEGNKTSWDMGSLASMLLQEGATVTRCSSDAPDLKKECLKGDVLCVAVGKPKTITGDMIKKDAVVIDMGMNMTSGGKVIGDIDFNTARKKASHITPVPGGIGPMTIAMLMRNTVLAAKKQSKTL